MIVPSQVLSSGGKRREGGTDGWWSNLRMMEEGESI